MLKAVYLKNFRRGLATNSSSTHSVIYKNKGELFEDLNIFNLNYYDRFDSTIAASKEAKIKYVLANIYHHEKLVEILSFIYPEMKQYYPLINKDIKNDDDSFGMYCRGNFFRYDNLEASIDYIREIIDNDDIVIIGGSDEMAFVYDKTEGHQQMFDIDGYDYTKGKQSIIKNGNYWLGYGYFEDKIADGKVTSEYKNSNGGRMRFCVKDETPIPEYPELIDLRITNKCNHGCKFCFMNSNMNEKDCDVKFITSILGQLKGHQTEFSIGGGNILLHPKLEEILRKISEGGHIVNVTIKADDCDTIINDSNLADIFIKYVNGLGISVSSVEDCKMAIKLKNFFYDKNCYLYTVCHMIPEYIGAKKVREIEDFINSSCNNYIPLLFLGYKSIGRGKNKTFTVFSNEDLSLIMQDQHYVSIDTTFAKRYFKWLSENFDTVHSITLNEGEYSMYIDAVTKNAYKSSYEIEKPYKMYYSDEKVWYRINEAFAEIRKDNGFEIFESGTKTIYEQN